MFPGNNSIEYPTQWALNPNAYQNMSNDQVDWAALAQQWIQMKESCPAAPSLPTPPAPQPAITVPVGEEGGEAPMDVDGNESDVPAAPAISPQQWKSVSGSSTWGNSWDQWGSGNQSNWGWQSNSTAKNSQAVPEQPCIGNYTATDTNYPGYNSSSQQNYRTGYWSTSENNEAAAGSVNTETNDSIGSRAPRRPFRHTIATAPAMTAPEVDTTQTIDAAKRRQLPAWIREGLEKMEREKQKQLEREKEKKNREEMLKYQKLEDGEAGHNDQKDDAASQIPVKSKFETDSDDSDNENKPSKTVQKDVPARERVAPPPPPILRSQEEIMQEIMLSVRRSLTEILLEVTNEQILSVCQEELGRKRSQPQALRGASVASKSQALSSIGGQLGLGIYGNSSGESDSENESEDGRRSSTPGDRRRKPGDITDSQLQETIKRRKAEFEKTTREIEAQLAIDEAGCNKSEHRLSSSVTNERSARTSRGMGESGSDGEDTTTHIRNEQNNVRQRKFSSEGTPPLDSSGKKPSTNSNAEKSEGRTTKSRNGDGRRSSDKAGGRGHKRDAAKRDKSRAGKSKKSKRSSARDGSTSRSTDSESESDSTTKKSDNSEEKRNRSTSDSSSSATPSTPSSSSGSSVHSSKKHAKKRKRKEGSSDESGGKSSKRSNKADKSKSKSKKNKKNKHAKSEKSSANAESQSSKKHDKEEYSPRDSCYSNARKSYTRTPERKSSYRSRYSGRSRSRSDDRKSNHGYDNHDRYYSSSSRHRSRERRDRARDKRDSSRDDRYSSKDKRDRSRDDRDRSRDDKDWHREDRERSRDRRERSKEKRDRDRRSDRRDYRGSRSSRY